MLDSLWRDALHSVRSIANDKLVGATLLLILGVGVGAAGTILSAVNTVLIQPLSYPRSDELVAVSHTADFQGSQLDVGFSASMYASYAESTRVFQEFGVWRSGTAVVTGIGDPEEIAIVSVTSGVLPALGVQPALGRWFSSEKNQETPPTRSCLRTSTGRVVLAAVLECWAKSCRSTPGRGRSSALCQAVSRSWTEHQRSSFHRCSTQAQ